MEESKQGKLVGVCNCKCHCSLKEEKCITNHDSVCEHCQKEQEHYTGGNAETVGCWCNPKMEYIPESDNWVITHNTLLEREDLNEEQVN